MGAIKTAFIALILSLALSGASNYYVDNAATGANNGTSWADAWTNIASAMSSAKAGDTVYISGGATSKTYVAGEYAFTYGGAPGNPLVLRNGLDANHNGKVILDGGASRTQFAHMAYGNSRTNIMFIGLTFKGYTGPTLNLDGSQFITISNCAFTAPAIRMLGGNNLKVEYCYFGATNADNCLSIGNGLTDWVVHHSTFYLSRADGISPNASNGDDGIGALGTDRGWCSNNVFIGFVIPSYTAGQHQDGLQVWGSEMYIHNNHFFNLGNSAIFFAPPSGSTPNLTNVQIYNNTVENCAEQIAIGNNNAESTAELHNFLVANNTISDSIGFVLHDSLMGTANNLFYDFLVANNIQINCYTDFALGSNVVGIANSNYTASNGSNYLTAYVRATDAYNTFENFNFYPLATAPFLNSGTNLSTYFTADITGATRSSWDIGAYEYQTNAPIVTTVIIPHTEFSDPPKPKTGLRAMENMNINK